MINTVLTGLLLLTVLAGLAGGVWIALRVRTIYGQIVYMLTPEADGKQSPIAGIAAGLASLAGRAAAVEVKTTLMGHASAQSRQLSAIQGDIAEDVAAAQPGLPGLLSAFPSLGKRIRKNPGLLDLAAPLLSRWMASNAQPTTSANGNHSAPAGDVTVGGFGARHGKF